MDLYEQNKLILEEFNLEFAKIIKDSDFISGKRVKSFEEQFAKFLDCNYCLGVANGTDALEIALLALDLPAGSDVIVPTNTFIGTAEAVKNVGLNVKWVKFDATHNMDPEDLEGKIDKGTSAIIFVHLYGNPSNIKEVTEVSNRFGVPLIEDCAQAHGANVNGRMVGTFGHVGTFSFFPGKNLGAFGDAGAVVSNDTKLIEKARMIANHGRKEKYYHEIIGRNSRLDVIQATCLCIKLKYLDLWTSARQNNAQFYLNGLNNNLLEVPLTKSECTHVYHHFVVKTKKIEEFKKYLSHKSIPYGEHYPYLLTELPSFGGLAKSKQNIVSIPVYENLSGEDRNYILKALNSYNEDE